MYQKPSEGERGIPRWVKILKDQLWLILGGGIFLLLLIQIGLRETLLALKSVNIFYLITSVCLITLGQQFIPFLKWVIMCRRAGMVLRTNEILYISSSILIGGIITPGRTGEFITALFFKATKGKMSSLVLFNRVIESSITFSIAIFIFGILFRNFLPSKSLILIGVTLGIILFLLYGLATKERFGIFILSVGKKLLITLKKVKYSQMILNVEENIVREVEHFYQSMRSLFSWRIVPVLIFFTFISWVVMTYANWNLFLSVGMDVPFNMIVAVMVLSAIGSFISPTPGGIGLGDIPPVAFLLLHGYDRNVGAFILLGRVAVYVVAFGWYFLCAWIYLGRPFTKPDWSEHKEME